MDSITGRYRNSGRQTFVNVLDVAECERIYSAFHRYDGRYKLYVSCGGQLMFTSQVYAQQFHGYLHEANTGRNGLPGEMCLVYDGACFK